LDPDQHTLCDNFGTLQKQRNSLHQDSPVSTAGKGAQPFGR